LVVANMKRTPVGPRWSRLPALLALSLGGSEASAPPVESRADVQAVTVQVSAGTRPTFTWTPACGMASTMVFAPAGVPLAWVVYGGIVAASNPFRSGMRYGQPPPGTFVAKPPAALHAGVDYQVVIYRWIGEPGGEGQPIQFGSATFRP
jgi:hypothetical protein